MSLEELQIDFPVCEPSREVASFIAESDKRIERFFDQNRGRRLPRYIPGEPLRVYSALRYITDNELALGNVFCEWGSGFGVCAGVATLLGYRSYGIEIEPELVELSRALAKDVKLGYEILNTSYLPEGFESYLGHGGYRLMPPGDLAFRQSSLNYSLAYEDAEQEIEIEDIDLFYVYPWPEEQDLMLELFDAVAAEDALLLAYYAQGDLNLYRKRLD